MNQSKRNLYFNALRQAGKRMTEQRITICNYLAATESHPTAYQVYEALAAQHPELSRATVYNTLNVLKELGAIVEVGFGTDHTHYDTDNAPHMNLICLRCHEISDYHGPLPIADVQKQVMGQVGFEPMVMRVDLLGFCEKCRTRKKAEIRQQWYAQHALGQRVAEQKSPEPTEYNEYKIEQ
jgi:Fur family peroxide stress response transcriptional regulator